MMQPRFERRFGSTPYSLVEQPRYRAGVDFLRLRADAGEIDAALPEWWEDFALGSDDEREAMIQAAREAQGGARRGAAPRSGGRSGGAAAMPADAGESLPARDAGDTVPGDADDGAAAATAPRKRRRRRRKPAGSGPGPGAPPAGDAGD
jgi:poly(A) polymerase